MKSVIKDIVTKSKVIQTSQPNLSRGQTIQKSKHFTEACQVKS